MSKKHLFVFSDGSWNDPEMDTQTNVFRLATMITHRCPLGYPQLVCYDPGVGTEGSLMQRLKGGAMGEGIDLNIQQLYTFLAMNYEDGDDIYLFGFSRGAYTVRSLAGMINEAGLLHRDKLGEVKEAYDLYRNNADIESETARSFRAGNARRVPIKLLACFDTVGALGIPVDAIPLGGLFFDQKKYAFHDTTVGREIEHAIHVLSIDEDRKGFAPTYMNPHPDKGPTHVTQVFMPGHHSGVGGGSTYEKRFSDNALRWMILEMQRRNLNIGWKKDMIPEEQDPYIPPMKLDFQYKMLRFLAGQKCREIPSVDMLHESTYKRYCGLEEWRPEALEKFETVDNFISNVEKFKSLLKK